MSAFIAEVRSIAWPIAAVTVRMKTNNIPDSLSQTGGVLDYAAIPETLRCTFVANSSRMPSLVDKQSRRRTSPIGGSVISANVKAVVASNVSISRSCRNAWRCYPSSPVEISGIWTIRAKQLVMMMPLLTVVRRLFYTFDAQKRRTDFQSGRPLSGRSETAGTVPAEYFERS